MKQLLLGLLTLVGNLLPTQGIAWNTIGWTTGLVLIAVLSIKEMLRAYGGPRTGVLLRGFDVAALPMLVLFFLAVLERVAHG